MPTYYQVTTLPDAPPGTRPALVHFIDPDAVQAVVPSPLKEGYSVVFLHTGCFEVRMPPEQLAVELGLTPPTPVTITRESPAK